MTCLKSSQVVFAIIAPLFVTSCFLSKSEGQLMASDIDRLKNEIATLQRERSDSETLNQRKQSEVDGRLVALENVTFKKAAIEGAENDQLKRELEDLRSQLEETQKNLETIKPTTPQLSSKEVVPEDKQEHFEWAKEAFADENFGLAYARADSFVEKYKNDKSYGAEAYLLKGDAAVMLAKSASTEAAKVDLNKKALAAYQDLLTRFPKSSKYAEGLFKVGEAMRTMGYASDAKLFYEEIVKKYPKSPFAKQAKERLATIKKKK